MKTKLQTVADLKPSAYNPRKISKAQLDALGLSMREFGDLSGIIFNRRTGNVVGGHQRLKQLDPRWQIDTATVRDKTGTVAEGVIRTPWGNADYREVDWDITKEKAANLAANQHGGVFDMIAVSDILIQLGSVNFNLDLTGFLEKDRPKASEPRAGEDEIPELAGKPKTKLGDLIQLGRHRLICGDATAPLVWKRLFEASPKASLVFTDPPYGVSYKARSGEFEIIKGDDKRDDGLLAMLAAAFKAAVQYSEKDAAFYIGHASSTREDFAAAIKAAGLSERQYLIWSKPSIGLGWSDYRWSHEPCFYASKAGVKPLWHGGADQATVWRATLTKAHVTATVLGPGLILRDGKGAELFLQAKPPKGKKLRAQRLEPGQIYYVVDESHTQGTVWEVSRDHDYKHPTQKPVELARRAIANSSRQGEIVVDSFLGSGTTLIAAELTNRTCYGTELDAHNCDVIVARWESITGKKAVFVARR